MVSRGSLVSEVAYLQSELSKSNSHVADISYVTITCIPAVGSAHLPPYGLRSLLKRSGHDELESVWRFSSIFPYDLLTWCLEYRRLTAWSRESENPIEKFPTFFARWSFITALIKDTTGLCPELDESRPHLRTPLLIPSFLLCLDLPGLFRFMFSVWNVGITSIRCEFPYWQSYSSLFYHFIC
jgi:hypothetical protein